MELEARLAFANQIAKAAGKRTLKYFQTTLFDVQKKEDGSPLTIADQDAERYLRKMIQESYPSDSIVGEEFESVEGSSPYRWILDPIDGTTNFLHGIPHFAISIALKSKNELLSGLIFDPIKDEMFFAEKDKGAFLNNQRLRVSKKNSLEDCLFSSNHDGVKLSNLNMRCSGSAALDLAYVASGRLDGYFQNKINLWDIAAGALMVKEAGGIVNDISKFDINKIDIKASSATISDKMLENLKNF